ncbi:MAG: hypothetical protein IKQ22_00795 [Clostridia bacterium]|nr:hypothetical protein [Clostridia bacterium]
MDALKTETIKALEQVIADSEGLYDIKITQDLDKEVLIIEDLNLERKTTMNCRMNSVEATLRQIAGHLYKHTLFSYDDPDYIIGMA